MNPATARFTGRCPTSRIPGNSNKQAQLSLPAWWAFQIKSVYFRQMPIVQTTKNTQTKETGQNRQTGE